MQLATTAEIIEEIKAGRMVVLVDDEDRENEGDLVLAADFVTPEAINFMAKYGRGLICLTLTEQRCRQLNLPLMVRDNRAPLGTAFTVSIEAATGVTTGISAYDRARTVQAAVAVDAKPEDVVQPGHIFPLMAQNGGVLVRAGHTEAGCDLAQLAGLSPTAVICEILKDDGTMARLPDLMEFAAEHNMKVASIADLIAYRRRTEKWVEAIHEGDFTSRYGGDFRMVIYKSRVGYAEHVALVKGDITTDEPVLVRMHALNVLKDVLGGGQSVLNAAMEEIGKEGRGVIVLLRPPSPTSLSDAAKDAETPPEDKGTVLRDYGVGAQILTDLGVSDMVLLSNTEHSIVGLDGYGLTISGRRAIPLQR